VGVLGPVPGLIGCLQAVEAMKVLMTFRDRDPKSSADDRNHSDYVPERTLMNNNASTSISDDAYCLTITSSSIRMQPLIGRQVVYDGLSGEFHCFQLPSRDFNCKVLSTVE